VLLITLTVFAAALVFNVDGPALWDGTVDDATILDARLSERPDLLPMFSRGFRSVF